MTSLNLFATKFEEVLRLCEKRADQVDHIFVDTPGQIEVFTWSASGTLITDALGATFPTVLLYVVDTARCRSPTTFMSNMLYACRCGGWVGVGDEPGGAPSHSGCAAFSTRRGCRWWSCSTRRTS